MNTIQGENVFLVFKSLYFQIENSRPKQIVNVIYVPCHWFNCFCAFSKGTENVLDVIVFVLFSIFILHSRESELYRYILDGKSAFAWELPFSRFMGHMSAT